VALFWNAPQHFYPYFGEVRTDWPAALREALGRAAADRDAGAFANTLRRLVAALHDGHGRVSGGGSGLAPLPLAWAWVAGRLVVTAVAESLAAGVRPGDTVLAIDGEPVAARLAAVAPLISHATPQHLRYLSGFWLMRGAGGDSVTLELRDPAGEPRRTRLGRLREARVIEDRPGPVAALGPGLWYVDFDRATDADVAAARDSLSAARGLVFDLRGYPSRISVDLLAHLADTALTSPPWAVPVVRFPDHRGLAFEFASYAVAPLEPRFRGRVAFVIDGRAISRAETYLAVVEHRRLGALVGEATAGTDGEVVTVPLPGGYRACFTGTRVLKPDGTRLHGVGVLPTVPVERTLAGVAARRDEPLERAIEIVSR
jgi:C-terminal processing protease CtpA/Prc